MNAKTVFALWFMAGWCCRAAAQPDQVETRGQWVTNWIAPPAALRVVRGRTYNTLISPRWQWLVLSNSFRETGDDGSDHAITNTASFRTTTVTTSITNATRDEFHVTVFHYPFNPTNFVAGKNGEVTPAAPLWMRVLPILGETNIVNGREVDSLMYDYGLACTNKIPVRKWKEE